MQKNGSIKWAINLIETKILTHHLHSWTHHSDFYNLIPFLEVHAVVGLYLNRRLTWNTHTRLKRTELNRRYQQLKRLLFNETHCVQQKTYLC